MNSWYTIRAQATGAEVVIYDEIGVSMAEQNPARWAPRNPAIARGVLVGVSLGACATGSGRGGRTGRSSRGCGHGGSGGRAAHR